MPGPDATVDPVTQEVRMAAAKPAPPAAAPG